ncbi:MAG: hypothetical protein L6R41_007295 [Letrouitia leprolyta]|nr:MAG: hypothetical protein L6R41_007295 [Letrouitia leprolyta]
MADGNFHPTSVEIFMFEQLIGTIYITKRSTTNSPSNDRMLPRRQDDDAKTIGPRSSPSNISDLEDGGRYIDPNRNDCSIVYEWSSGKIDSKDIFTTIMEAMIIVAYDGTHVPFDALNAVSASGNCAMNIHKTPGIPDQPSGFKATTLLFLLPNLIVQQRRFQGLDFSFEFGAPGTPQKSIFQGFIMGLGSPKDQSYSKVAATS